MQTSDKTNTIFRVKNKLVPEYYEEQLVSLWDEWQKNNSMQDKSKDNFFSYLEKKYFDEMVGFLKNELKIVVPIEGSQYSDASSLESCDFIDTHVYWDHPRFPNKPWDKNDFKIHNKSMLLDKNLGIIGEIKSRELKIKKHYNR